MRKTWERELQIDVGESEGYCCVRLSGEGERCGSVVLGGALQKLLQDGRDHTIVDTRDILFLHPQCVEALADAARLYSQAGGALVVVDQSLPVERALKLLNLEHFVPVFRTPAQAIEYLDEHE
jgi:anti-anti-sigma factor